MGFFLHGRARPPCIKNPSVPTHPAELFSPKTAKHIENIELFKLLRDASGEFFDLTVSFLAIFWSVLH